MKKILFIVTLLFVVTLTGCANKPFSAEDGYTFITTDTIEYSFFNGVEDIDLLNYTFEHTHNVFLSDDGFTYNYKNINNYKEISSDFNTFIESFTPNIVYERTYLSNFDDTIKLSLGATEDDFNYEKVDLDEDVYKVDAYISAPNGLNILVSYHELSVDGTNYIMPSYIQFYVNAIHESVSWEFLPESNDYLDTFAKLINYKTIIVPTPMQTGATSNYSVLQGSDDVELSLYQRVVQSDGANTDTWTVCEGDATENCMPEFYTELEVQIYNMVLSDVITFYEDNYQATYDDGDFVFVNLGYTFVILDMEEVQVRNSNNDIVNVVNATIRVY